MPKYDQDLEPGVIYDIREQSDSENLQIADAEFQVIEELRGALFTDFKKRKKIALVLVPLLLALSLWAAISILQNMGSGGGFFLPILVISLAPMWVYSPKRKYTKIYKKTFIPMVAKLFGNFTYELKGKIDEYILLPSKIMPEYDRYTSEDYFTGQYKNTQIQFSEIDLAIKKKNKNSTYYHSVFKGLAILFKNPNKRFYGHTIIDQNSSGMMEWFKEKAHGLKRANLVDPKFEKIYDVYTNDQVEARYLIHPLIIERLTDLSERYHGKKLTAAFYEDKFLILIASSHNHFEPARISMPATSTDSLFNLKKEIEDILAIGDQLELYKDTGREN